ncbi:hypothetical protein ASPSYDRAFT_52043 [Aspergillus sydowii CBS 593.65]|uniref:Uncharacterized protein n=1 Tax=Aspergillus sydowii CBS 593.65 TaxID=1036612 RepID=A0A1L9SZE8_9EURO|nr:uncharacterized protein ASPSYDRAFT_52043 [Aspergillus sydowii CBS 593.65]OJJ52413.1 hypothetical protein ASPSYDRAFT_52043 [Aspergillus sydowii CBS 593.65]
MDTESTEPTSRRNSNGIHDSDHERLFPFRPKEHERPPSYIMCHRRYFFKQGCKLNRAIRKNDLDGVRIALANGVSPDYPIDMCPSPITLCIRYERLEFMDLLFEHGVQSPQPCVELNGFDDELLVAAGKGNLEILKALVAYREEERGYFGFTPGYIDEAEPIHAAARGNKTVPGCMGWLLDRGARINEETPHWRTPLHFAVDQRQPRVDVVRFLLDRGADVDHVTEYGQTAIYLAARRAAGRVVRELLKRAPRLDEKTRTEEMVLHAAAANCSLRTVKMLVEAGADVYARDNRGWSVLQFAREAGQTETAQWITENIPWGPC